MLQAEKRGVALPAGRRRERLAQAAYELCRLHNGSSYGISDRAGPGSSVGEDKFTVAFDLDLIEEASCSTVRVVRCLAGVQRDLQRPRWLNALRRPQIALEDRHTNALSGGIIVQNAPVERVGVLGQTERTSRIGMLKAFP